MRLNSANRAFAGTVALALTPFVMVVAAFCGATGALAARLISRPQDAGDLVPGLVVLVVLTVGLALTAVAAARQWRATRRLDAEVAAAAVDTPVRVQSVAGRSVRVVVVADVAPFSFAYGLLSVTVVLSEGLVDACSDAELAAVLAHEQYHIASRDPLKIAMTRALVAGAFYLPALRTLLRRYVVGRELAADRRAIRRCGRAPLAGALYHAVAGPFAVHTGAAAALGGPDVLDVRLTQLETGHEPALPAMSRGAVAGTAGSLLLVATVLLYTYSRLVALHLTSAPGTGEMALSWGGALACAAPWLGGAGLLVWHRRRRQSR